MLCTEIVSPPAVCLEVQQVCHCLQQRLLPAACCCLPCQVWARVVSACFRYPGTNKGMLMTNTLFRVGGAAILLSNKRSESWYALRLSPWGVQLSGCQTNTAVIITSEVGLFAVQQSETVMSCEDMLHARSRTGV